MEKINDYFSVTGNEIDIFKKEVSEMNDITRISKFYLTHKYTFMSVLSVQNDKVMVVLLNSSFISLYQTGAFFTMNCSEDTLKEKWSFIKTIDKTYFEKNFAGETIKTDDLLILDENNRVLFIAEEAYRTMLARFNISCDGMLTKSLARNVMIADRMYYYEGITSTCVTRHNKKGYEKVMAVMSDKYAHIHQTILCDVIDELQKTEKLSCIDFKIDNRISLINLKFEEKEQEIRDVYKIDNAIPGIYLATSDTGDCSITAKAFFQFGNSRAMIGEIARKHEGNIDKNIMLDEIMKKLFPMYREVPDKLIKLMSMDITNPEIALKKALKHIELVKLIGKKNEMAVSEQLMDEIVPTMRYTAYDIVIMVLQIAERIKDISNEAKRKLEGNIIKVIDTDFSKISTSVIASLAD